MKTLEYELDAGSTDIGRVRSILEQAVSDHFGDGLLRHEWRGDVLQLSGPGAKGSIVHESGKLRLRAQLRPPASFVRGTIKRKIEGALADVAAKIG